MCLIDPTPSVFSCIGERLRQYQFLVQLEPRVWNGGLKWIVTVCSETALRNYVLYVFPDLVSSMTMVYFPQIIKVFIAFCLAPNRRTTIRRMRTANMVSLRPAWEGPCLAYTTYESHFLGGNEAKSWRDNLKTRAQPSFLIIDEKKILKCLTVQISKFIKPSKAAVRNFDLKLVS